MRQVVFLKAHTECCLKMSSTRNESCEDGHHITRVSRHFETTSYVIFISLLDMCFTGNLAG